MPKDPFAEHRKHRNQRDESCDFCLIVKWVNRRRAYSPGSVNPKKRLPPLRANERSWGIADLSAEGEID